MFAANTNATGAAYTDAGTNNRIWTGGADNKSQIATWIAGSFAANSISLAALTNGVARSVVGVTGNASAAHADIQGATDQVLRVNGAGTALEFGAVDISKAAAVTSTLAVGNGGTGLTGGTSGGVPYYSAASTLASSGALTANALIKGGGAGNAPVASGVTADSSNNVAGANSLTISRADAGLALDFVGGTEPGSFNSGHGQIGGGSMDLSGNMWISGGFAVGTHTTASAGSILAITGVGYSTGAGGAVTQGTSRTTAVEVNTPCGAITLFSAAGSATPASFTVTNNKVAATDTIVLSQKSGTDKYILLVTAVAGGSFQITFYTTGGTTTEQPVINFSVVKAVAA